MDTLYKKGIIKKINEEELTVEILSCSACSACVVKNYCTGSETKQKEIVVKKQDDGSEMLNFFPNCENEFCCQLVVPIVKDGDAIGSIIILASENKCFDDSSVKICKCFAKYISDQIY